MKDEETKEVKDKQVEEANESKDIKTETTAEEPKKEVKEDVKPKVGEPEEAKVDVGQLRAELQEAQEKASQVETLNATVETMKVEVESKNTLLKEYEDLLGTMITTKMEQVPAEFKELIPDNLDLKQKLSWLEKAEAKGLFNKEAKKKPDVEIGKPVNVAVPQVDTSKLTGGQLLKMAYSTISK